jgi:hypothetical protein
MFPPSAMFDTKPYQSFILPEKASFVKRKACKVDLQADPKRLAPI